jgi:DNA-binding CsgD family transcriptional regulator
MKLGRRSISRLHNLPLHLTPFVGRHKERAELARLLSDPVRRLLTLVGPGGIGKTRLGLQVAAELLPQHPDGVWLVQLADLFDPALVPQAAASALGVREQPDRPLLETLALFRELGDQAGIATVLLYQGIAACHKGDHAAATVLLQQSLPSLRELGDTVAVARAVHGLGVAARHQGHLAGAQKLFREALQVAGEKGARLEISECLEGLAGVACDQGQPRRAARLFGMAEALREAIGADRPSAIRADYVRDVAATRAQLEEKAFTSAWARGRSAALEQATAYALAQADGAEPGSDTKGAPGARALTPLQAAKLQYDGLTARERQVAALVAQGKSNSAIASELVVAVRTVETHITHMLRKLGFSSRAQVAAWAVDKGLAPPPKTVQEKMDQGDLSPNSPASRPE